MKTYLVRFFALTVSMTLSGVAVAEDYAVRMLKSNMVPMRDGTLLSTDLYLPEGATGKLPVILIRTVYGKNPVFEDTPVFQTLVGRGYVIAVQDIRGRFESEGKYVVARNRREDGYDTVEWLIAQDWSNQKVGTAGCSYLGETQVVLAAAKHPAHLTAIPMSPGKWLLCTGTGLVIV